MEPRFVLWYPFGSTLLLLLWPARNATQRTLMASVQGPKSEADLGSPFYRFSNCDEAMMMVRGASEHSFSFFLHCFCDLEMIHDPPELIGTYGQRNWFFPITSLGTKLHLVSKSIEGKSDWIDGADCFGRSWNHPGTRLASRVWLLLRLLLLLLFLLLFLLLMQWLSWHCSLGEARIVELKIDVTVFFTFGNEGYFG